MKKMPKQLSERTLRSLKKHDRILAQTIEEEMFIFENLRDLDKKSLSSVLRSVDAAQLAIALKGADEEMVDMCLATMSQRAAETRSEEHTSELQSLMRSSYAVFCLKKKKTTN